MKKLFNQLKRNDKLNTSYPIEKSQWLEYKTEENLKFDSKDMCFYIHIPFCMSKCKFCEYIKFIKTDDETEEKYVNVLISDIENFTKTHQNKLLKGVDVGGGTPTCLSKTNFEKLLTYLSKLIKSKNVSKDFEPSIEATFNTITEEKLRIISECGFKRISFGIQTVNKKFLKDNDRYSPTLEKIKSTFDWCKKYDIKKINLDLMYGLLGQTKKDLKNSIELIKYLMPSQVTLYEMRTNILQIKEYKTKKQLYNQYKFLFNNLKKLGYHGNFAQNTFSLSKTDLGLSSYLKHRMINNVNYKGFGISAQSKADNGISYNVGKAGAKLNDCLSQGTFFCEDTYVLPKTEMLAKYVAVSGYYGQLNLDIMSNILGQDSTKYFEKQLSFLLKNKYIKINKKIISITQKGFKHYGAVLALFYPMNKI